MIAKDEAAGIRRALSSVADIVDEMIVMVDDQTVDDTARIAAEVGARVIPFKWPTVEEGGFSAARNAVQAEAKTEWVFVVDGHEYIEGRAEVIVETMNSVVAGIDSFALLVEMDDGRLERSARIHRKSASRWENPVHNKLVVDGPCIGIPASVRLIHDRIHGQSPESNLLRKQQRREMSYSVFPEKIRKNPRDVRSIYYLAQQYFTDGNFAAAAYWFDRYLRTDPEEYWVEEKYQILSRYGMVAGHLGDVEVLKRCAIQSIELLPGRAEGWLLYGDYWFESGNYVVALTMYLHAQEKCMGAGESAIGAEPSVLSGGWKLLYHIAMCYERLEQYEEALDTCQSILLSCVMPKEGRAIIADKVAKLVVKTEQVARGEHPDTVEEDAGNILNLR